jgi:hypothetical protein
MDTNNISQETFNVKWDKVDFEKVDGFAATITPEIAKELLLRNIKTNRNVNKDRVRKYAQMMLNGEWELCSPITFSKNGVGLDFQHRMNAVILANIPVNFMVQTGLPESSAQKFDQGMQRNATHIAKLRGNDLSARQVGIVSAMFYFRGNRFKTLSDFVSPSGVATIASMPEMIEPLEFAQNYLQKGSCRVAAILAVFARAYLALPEGDDEAFFTLDKFVQTFQKFDYNGNELEKSPFILRQFAQSIRDDRCAGGRSQRECFEKTQYAIHCYMHKIKVLDKDDLICERNNIFPVPFIDEMDFSTIK